jgi:hypothetical protein
MTTSGGFSCRCIRMRAAPAQVGRGYLPDRIDELVGCTSMTTSRFAFVVVI